MYERGVCLNYEITNYRPFCLFFKLQEFHLRTSEKELHVCILFKRTNDVLPSNHTGVLPRKFNKLKKKKKN